jgi:uncharacterized protein with ParB-like and HNH nuclease domain
MKAEELKVVNVLTENRKYIIPSYQRPYSWSEEHTIQLIKDIYDSFEEKTQEYFIGSLICIDKGNNEYEVVDGQQRLTTLSLILAKIRDLVNNRRLKENLQNRVLPINPYTNESEKPRLKVRKKEEDLYLHYILQGKNEYRPENPTHTEKLFINNFDVIGNYLMDNLSEERLPELAKYILENVYIIFVQTNSFASSYRLFHVLNTRGLSLKQSDLLKNSLFEIAERTHKSSDDIERHWSEIEEIIGVENIDKFLSVYEFSRKTNKNRVASGVHLAKNLSELVNSYFNKDVVDFVRDLKKSARYYQCIKEVNFKNEKTKQTFQLLIDNIIEEWVPPILAYLNKNGTESIEFSEFVTLFEKCYLHQWFSKKYKNSRESICYDVIVNINTNESFEKIKEGMISYANNDELIRYLHSDIYESHNSFKLSKYVLLKIDQEMQDSSVIKHYSGTITIEHVLPQVMKDDYWTNRFSSDDHKIWVHKLGNLTLLNGHKNSKSQNFGFDKKREIYSEKSNKVSFDIAKNVLEYKEWNIKNLKHRHELLLEFAKNIWLVEGK